MERRQSLPSGQICWTVKSVHAVIQNPSSWDEHVYARGQRDALNFVLNLETILENRVMEMHVAEDVEELEESLSL
jgi:hypothetical protein